MGSCLEIGENWIDPLKDKLTEYNVPLDNMEFVTASTDDLPFQDKEFDFVASNGVLVHLNDVIQAEKAFAELSRVTKEGGHLYVVLGTVGGLVEEELFPAFRRYYRNNVDFKEMIDSISPEVIRSILRVISEGMHRHTGEKFDYDEFARLFDWDFCAFVQNIIQAPKRFCIELNREWVEKQFGNNGFELPLRCRRYVVRKNIRKYLAPIHYDLESKMSKILYGEGNMKWISVKKGEI